MKPSRETISCKLTWDHSICHGTATGQDRKSLTGSHGCSIGEVKNKILILKKLELFDGAIYELDKTV